MDTLGTSGGMTDIDNETEVAVAAGGWLAGKGVDILRAAVGMTGRGGGGGITNSGLVSGA